VKTLYSQSNYKRIWEHKINVFLYNITIEFKIKVSEFFVMRIRTMAIPVQLAVTFLSDKKKSAPHDLQ